MNLKNIIILGELDYVLAASFDVPQNKAKCLAYDANLLPMERNEDGATNINCLYVLNEMLESIKEVKMQKNGFLPETSYIAVPKKLHTLILKGAYKNWIKNDGVAKTGKVFDKREMHEWARFSTLYGDLFSDVTLRDATYYEMSRPKHDIANMNKHKEIIKHMKANIEANKQQQLENILA